ncbi:hypothetical protein PT2222_120147 [Paraburkholderia tropica]
MTDIRNSERAFFFQPLKYVLLSINRKHSYIPFIKIFLSVEDFKDRDKYADDKKCENVLNSNKTKQKGLWYNGHMNGE